MRLVDFVGLPAFAAVLGVALALPASAQRRDTGFDLVRLDASTRAAAMAGAPGALGGADPTVAFYNPALLTSDMSRTAAVGYTNHVSEIAAGTLLYARDVPRVGATLAASVRYLSYGDFDGAGADGTPDGTTFGAGEAALTLSGAREVAPRVRAGASVNLLTTRIADARGAALTADLGATYEVPSQQLTLGASVHHVGATLSSLGATTDRLPTDVRLTVAKRLRYLPLTVSVAGYDLAGIQSASAAQPDSSSFGNALDHVALGGELQLGRALALRAGFNPRRAGDLDGGRRLDLGGVSMGFGLSLSRVALDYAYNGWSVFGGTHQFGLRTRL